MATFQELLADPAFWDASIDDDARLTQLGETNEKFGQQTPEVQAELLGEARLQFSGQPEPSQTPVFQSPRVELWRPVTEGPTPGGPTTPGAFELPGPQELRDAVQLTPAGQRMLTNPEFGLLYNQSPDMAIEMLERTSPALRSAPTAAKRGLIEQAVSDRVPGTIFNEQADRPVPGTVRETVQHFQEESFAHFARARQNAFSRRMQDRIMAVMGDTIDKAQGTIQKWGASSLLALRNTADFLKTQPELTEELANDPERLTEVGIGTAARMAADLFGVTAQNGLRLVEDNLRERSGVNSGGLRHETNIIAGRAAALQEQLLTAKIIGNKDIEAKLQTAVDEDLQLIRQNVERMEELGVDPNFDMLHSTVANEIGQHVALGVADAGAISAAGAALSIPGVVLLPLFSYLSMAEPDQGVKTTVEQAGMGLALHGVLKQTSKATNAFVRRNLSGAGFAFTPPVYDRVLAHVDPEGRRLSGMPDFPEMISSAATGFILGGHRTPTRREIRRLRDAQRLARAHEEIERGGVPADIANANIPVSPLALPGIGGNIISRDAMAAKDVRWKAVQVAKENPIAQLAIENGIPIPAAYEMKFRQAAEGTYTRAQQDLYLNWNAEQARAWEANTGNHRDAWYLNWSFENPEAGGRFAVEDATVLNQKRGKKPKVFRRYEKLPEAARRTVRQGEFPTQPPPASDPVPSTYAPPADARGNLRRTLLRPGNEGAPDSIDFIQLPSSRVLPSQKSPAVRARGRERGKPLPGVAGEEARLTRSKIPGTNHELRGGRMLLELPTGVHITLGRSNATDLTRLVLEASEVDPTTGSKVRRSRADARAKILEWGGWYRNGREGIKNTFGPGMFEDIATVWQLSQQGTGPEAGLTNTMKVLSQEILGRPFREGEKPGAGLADTVMREVLRTGRLNPQGSNVGPKRYDFLDAMMGMTTRTYAMNDGRAGGPAPIDIWAARFLGYRDPDFVSRLKKIYKAAGDTNTVKLLDTMTTDLVKVGRDEIGNKKLVKAAPAAPAYEYGARRYNELADYWNQINFQGKSDWRPYEAQAAVWMAGRAALGDNPRMPSEIIERAVSPEFVAEVRAKYPKRAFEALADANLGMVMSSQARTETLGFDEALRMVTRPEQSLFEDIAKNTIELVAKTSAKVDKNAVGFWSAEPSNSAEPAMFAEFRLGPKESFAEVRAAAALQGLAGNQKAVLPFVRDPAGSDFMYELRLPPDVTLQQAREVVTREFADFNARGLGWGATMLIDPTAGSARRVLVYQDNASIMNGESAHMAVPMGNIADALGARGFIHQGRGELLGSFESRIEGAEKFVEAIRETAGSIGRPDLLVVAEGLQARRDAWRNGHRGTTAQIAELLERAEGDATVLNQRRSGPSQRARRTLGSDPNSVTSIVARATGAVFNRAGARLMPDDVIRRGPVRLKEIESDGGARIDAETRDPKQGAGDLRFEFEFRLPEETFEGQLRFEPEKGRIWVEQILGEKFQKGDRPIRELLETRRQLVPVLEKLGEFFPWAEKIEGRKLFGMKAGEIQSFKIPRTASARERVVNESQLAREGAERDAAEFAARRPGDPESGAATAFIQAQGKRLGRPQVEGTAEGVTRELRQDPTLLDSRKPHDLYDLVDSVAPAYRERGGDKKVYVGKPGRLHRDAATQHGLGEKAHVDPSLESGFVDIRTMRWLTRTQADKLLADALPGWEQQSDRTTAQARGRADASDFQRVREELDSLGVRGEVQGQIIIPEGGPAAEYPMLVRLFAGGDFSTLVHENAHGVRRLVGSDSARFLERHYGVKNGQWTEPQEHQFVRDVNRFLMEDRVISRDPEVRNIFEKMGSSLRKIYQKTRGDMLDNRLITPELDAELQRIYSSEKATEAARENRGPDPALTTEFFPNHDLLLSMKVPTDALDRVVNSLRETPVGEELPLPKAETKFLDNYNTKIQEAKGPDDVRALLQGLANTISRDSEPRAKRITHRDVDMLAHTIGIPSGEQLLAGWGGSVMSAPEIRAAIITHRTMGRAIRREVEAYKAKLDVGDTPSPQEKLKVMNNLTKWMAVDDVISKQKTEIARALNILQSPLDLEDPGLRRSMIDGVLASQGGNIDKIATQLATAESYEHMHNYARKVVTPTWQDALTEAWVSGLVSALPTHVVNFTSNSAVALWEVPRTEAAAIASTVEATGRAVARGVTGGRVGKRIPPEQRVRHGEAVAKMYGWLSGARVGIGMAGRELADAGIFDPVRESPGRVGRAVRRVSAFDAGKRVPGLEEFQKVEFRQRAFTPEAFGLERGEGLPQDIEVLGRIVNLPFVGLQAGDAVFKGIGFTQEMSALAYRGAMAEGHRVASPQFWTRVRELMNDPTPEMLRASTQRALRNTFTEPLGEAGRSFQSIVGNLPLGRLIIPFMATPANVAKFTVASSPMGPAVSILDISRMRRGLPPRTRFAEEATRDAASRANAIGQSVLGSSVMGWSSYLAAQGRITGGGPSDPDAREQLFNTGWQPYSFHVGDTYYPFGRVEPLASLLGLGADFANSNAGRQAVLSMASTLGLAADFADTRAYIDDDTADNLAMAMVVSLSRNLTSKTFLRGVSLLTSVMDRPELNAARFQRSYAQSLIPRNIAQAERAIDPSLSDARTFMDQVMSQIPGQSGVVPNRLDAWGRAIEPPASYWNPFQTTRVSNEKIFHEVVRLGMKLDQPPRRLFGPESPELTPWEYHRFSTMAGWPALKMADLLVNEVVPIPGQLIEPVENLVGTSIRPLGIGVKRKKGRAQMWSQLTNPQQRIVIKRVRTMMTEAAKEAFVSQDPDPIRFVEGRVRAALGMPPPEEGRQ